MDGVESEEDPEEVPWSEDFVFDTKYFKESNPESETYEAKFRVTDGDNEGFIVLGNCHNGYYSHGFEFIKRDAVKEPRVLQEGSL